MSNSGNVTLTATTAGALNDGNAADVINYTQITTTAATLTSATALPAPMLTNGAGSTSHDHARSNGSSIKMRSGPTRMPTPPRAGGRHLRRWRPTNVNNGRVIYTASMP